MLATSKVDFAILSAMSKELAFLNDFFSEHKQVTHVINNFEFIVYDYNDKKILVGYTGLGTTFSASILTLIHQNFSPDYFFLAGTAGGINYQLKMGDVVIVEKAFEAELQELFSLVSGTPFEECLVHPLKKQHFPLTYTADDELLSIATQLFPLDYKGTAVSSNAFPAPRELFDKIKNKDPYCIDMETSAFYQVAWLFNLRVLAVRGISNVLNHDGTDDSIHASEIQKCCESAIKVILGIIDFLTENKALDESNKLIAQFN